MENMKNGAVSEYDFGHNLVEKIVEIIGKRVSVRRGNGQENVEKIDELKKPNLIREIKDDLENIKRTVEEIKKELVGKKNYGM